MSTQNPADNFKGATGHRWEPGESGNPAGRQPDSLTTLLKSYLEQGDGKAHKKKVVQALVDLAQSIGSSGQVAAIKEIFDRVDGKVIDKHISITVTATPESIREAQERLLIAQDDTNKLLERYPNRNATE